MPTDANLLEEYAGFAALEAACAAFCEQVNARPHRVTRRAPAEMLAEEAARLHPVPAAPFTAALGVTRRVDAMSLVAFEGGQYSVPHQLAGEVVHVRRHGEQVIIAHAGPAGPAEAARHRLASPGSPRLDDAHYPPAPPGALNREPKARTKAEAEFLAIGPGAGLWLAEAAAAGTARVRAKMAQAAGMAALHGAQAVDRALGLVISDGAPGLIAAIEQAYPKALRGRCLIHRCRNILAKVPAGMQAEVKDAYWKIFDTEGLKTPPGPKLVDLTGARISEMAARYAPTYPAAMKALTTDAAGLTAYLRFPAKHHQRIRHSNFIEPTFGETRRRVKVIGGLPGETSCLTLVWAVLDRASAGWRGVNMTPDGLRLLQDLRRSLPGPPTQLRPHTVTTSQPADGSETVTTVA